MKRLIALLFFLPSLAFAQAVQLSAPAAPVPSTACAAPTTAQYCFQYYDGSKWNVVIVAPPTGSAFTLNGSTVVLPASGGGGTTYTGACGIQIAGTVISENWPSVAMPFTSGSHAIVTADMGKVQIINSASPVSVVFPATSTITGCNVVELQNVGAGSASLSGPLLGQPTVLSGGLNQSIVVRFDETGANWRIDRGAGQ